MKKVLTSAFALLFSLTAAFANTEGTTSPAGSNPSFGSSVYTSATTQKLHVAIDKQEGKSVKILLVNEQGEAILRKSIEKEESSFRGRFVMDQLEDGTYKLLITDGTTTRTHKVTIKTSAPVLAPSQIIILQ